MIGLITSEKRDAWQGLADDLANTRPSVGKIVIITKGKHQGKQGIVTWHGPDRFYSHQYESPAQTMLQDMAGTAGWRVGVRTRNGETFFVNADKVEVV